MPGEDAFVLEDQGPMVWRDDLSRRENLSGCYDSIAVISHLRPPLSRFGVYTLGQGYDPHTTLSQK